MINKFYFQKAKYLISDEFGNEVVLENNYKDKKFKIVPKVKMKYGYKFLENKVSSVAVDLLNRKHNVNFSNKFI